MKITFPNKDGSTGEIDLTDQAISIGRSPDADIVLYDERSSRMHCGIRLWEGDFYVKDLQSKNGTYLNEERIEMSKLNSGDVIRIGASKIVVDGKKGPGPQTIMGHVEDDMAHGKGYNTILREIVDDVEPKAAPQKKRLKTASNKKPVQIKLKRPPKKG
jgi:two-component system NtrC family sensor kinase